MKNVRADHSSGVHIEDNSKNSTVTIKKSNFVFGIAIVSIAVLALIFFAFIFPNMRNSGANITGDWEYRGHSLSLYSDGTYEMSGEYGTGHYTILDDGRLKLTDFYGESKVFYFSVTSDTLTISPTKDGDGTVLTRK